MEGGLGLGFRRFNKLTFYVNRSINYIRSLLDGT